jgi:hypothetical protein
VHFVTKVSLYFWNLHNILHLLTPIKSTLWEKKILVPYIVNDPECQDLWWSSHWVKTKNVIIFFTFKRDTTNYRSTHVENVRKSQKSTLPTVQTPKLKWTTREQKNSLFQFQFLHECELSNISWWVRNGFLPVVSRLVYEVGVPGGTGLPAVVARVAGMAPHVLGLHVVLHPLPRRTSRRWYVKETGYKFVNMK